jgi:hypothetical protein
VTGGNQVIRPTGIESALIMGTPTIRMRQQVTMQHLWTARHAARLCGEREAQILRQNTVDTELRSQAMTSIFFAAAIPGSAGQRSGPRPGGPERSNFTYSWPTPQRHPGIPSALETRAPPRHPRQVSAGSVNCGKPQYDARRNPARGVQLLIELRHHFMHYKPEWRDVDAEHHFEHALKRAKVVENQQPIGAPWFANKALGAGLADWSCDITTKFANSWWKRMGLKGRFDASFNQLPPP